MVKKIRGLVKIQIPPQIDHPNTFLADKTANWVLLFSCFVLKQTADVVGSVEIVTTDGKFQTLSRVDFSFGYRSSPFQDMEDLAAIADVPFRLKHSESARRRQLECSER